MTAVRPFDPAEPLGPGRTIVEASAGTGKTFTIAAAVTRLVAADAVPLQRILVAHADPITEDPVRQLAEAWSFAIPADRVRPSATPSRG